MERREQDFVYYDVVLSLRLFKDPRCQLRAGVLPQMPLSHGGAKLCGLSPVVPILYFYSLLLRPPVENFTCFFAGKLHLCSNFQISIGLVCLQRD